MSGVDWGILTTAPNPGLAFAYGMQQGQQQRRETQTQNALAAYAQNPDDEGAARNVLSVDPRLGMQLMEQQRERQHQTRIIDVRRRAASGDHDAMTELFTLEPETWTKLDAPTREKAKQATSFMGNAVLSISRLPPEQRPQVWAQYVQQAEASGLDIPPHYEQYSEAAMNAAASEAGLMEKVIKQFEPDYVAVPAGGQLINKNPLSPGFNPQAATASVGAPQPGHVEDGYRFKGGNPADPSAWERVGGAGPQTPRPFPR